MIVHGEGGVAVKILEYLLPAAEDHVLPLQPVLGDTRHRNPLQIQVPVFGEVEIGPWYWDHVVPVPLAHPLVQIGPSADTAVLYLCG